MECVANKIENASLISEPSCSQDAKWTKNNEQDLIMQEKLKKPKAKAGKEKIAPPPFIIMIQNRFKDLLSLVALIILLNKAMEVGAGPIKQAISELVNNISETLEGLDNNGKMAPASSVQDQAIEELK